MTMGASPRRHAVTVQRSEEEHKPRFQQAWVKLAVTSSSLVALLGESGPTRSYEGSGIAQLPGRIEDNAACELAAHGLAHRKDRGGEVHGTWEHGRGAATHLRLRAPRRPSQRN